MTSLNRLSLSVSTLGLLTFMATGSLAHGNERGEAKATIGNAHVSIDYGRPSLKGRDPLKMMQPGKFWRIGADASTTIESDAPLDFGGVRVPKGKHILLAHLVAPGKWTLVVSTKPYNQYEPGAKIAEVPMTLAEAQDPVETVTIQVVKKDGGGNIEIAWGKMRLSASFTAAK